MNSLYFRCITSALTPFLFILGHSAYGQSPTTVTATIEVDLARFTANQHVNKYYPEFEWRNVDHMVLHDIDGTVKAYTFVFAESHNEFRSSEDLQRHIQEKAAQLREAQEKVANAAPEAQAEGQTNASVVEAEENLYNFNNLATVITGATNDSKLILRHFRGLPSFWADAEMLDADTSVRLYGKSLQVSRVIMITPMDFRLIAFEGNKRAETASDVRNAEKATIPDSAYVLSAHGKKPEKMSVVRKARQSIETRKQQRLKTLEPAERARYEKAQQDRAKALANEWRQYRELWIKSQDENEGTR